MRVRRTLAEAYVKDRLADNDIERLTLKAQVGGKLSRDRCLVLFSIRLGGVYLEQEGIEGRSESEGVSDGSRDYQVNIPEEAYR